MAGRAVLSGGMGGIMPKGKRGWVGFHPKESASSVLRANWGSRFSAGHALRGGVFNRSTQGDWERSGASSSSAREEVRVEGFLLSVIGFSHRHPLLLDKIKTPEIFSPEF
jgi:outer membrane receptor for monomeric catechols